jgi:hypothetical protein
MSDSEYMTLLADLVIKMPKHPLLRKLSEGYNTLNVVYMKQAKKDLQVASEQEKVPANSELKRLYVIKSALFGKRARLSNKLVAINESPAFNQARARVIDDIEAVQREIEDVKVQIRRVEAGTIIRQQTPAGPDLMRRLLSLRAAVSRERRLVKAGKGDERLKTLEKQLSDVENQIADSKQQ